MRTADCAVPGYRVHKDGNGVGSLLLGLYTADGDMRSVGVAASFSVQAAGRAARGVGAADRPGGARRPPVGRLGDVAGRTAAARAANEAAGKPTPPSAGSRWNAGKDLSFVPIRMGLVAEVTFGQLEGGRFRHGVGFVRWRPDRTPESCRFDQLDVATPGPASRPSSDLADSPDPGRIVAPPSRSAGERRRRTWRGQPRWSRRRMGALGRVPRWARPRRGSSAAG